MRTRVRSKERAKMHTISPEEMIFTLFSTRFGSLSQSQHTRCTSERWPPTRAKLSSSGGGRTRACPWATLVSYFCRFCSGFVLLSGLRATLSLPPSAFARDAASPATPPCAALEDYVAIKAKDTVYLPHTGACAARFAPRVAQPLCWRGVARLPPRHPRPPPPLLFAAGRYQVKRFRKALCPIVERLCNALMRKGRNNGKKLLAGACAAPPRAAAAAAPRRHAALHRTAPPPLPAFCSAHRAAGV